LLEIYTLPRSDHEESKNLNRLIMIKKSISIFKNVPAKKSPEPGGFINEF
jgi:hypothetical protein